MASSSFTAFFLLLTFSCFVSHCLSRPISVESASDPPKAAVDKDGKFGAELWFDHPWHKKPWSFAHSPKSHDDHDGDYEWDHWKDWSFAHSPKSHDHDGDYEWDHWKDWPFAHSPKSHDGWKWWPKNEEVAADAIEEAKVATPPIAA